MSKRIFLPRRFDTRSCSGAPCPSSRGGGGVPFMKIGIATTLHAAVTGLSLLAGETAGKS